MSVLDKQFIFIIGSPRSGTTWLQTMLSVPQCVATTVELTLFDGYVKSWVEKFDNEKRTIDAGKGNAGLPFLWDREDLHEHLLSFLTKVYTRLLEKHPEATHILDKRPGYSKYTDYIHWLLSNAKFLHIIRDGRDVVSSIMKTGEKTGWFRTDIKSATQTWTEYVSKAREASSFVDQYMEVRYEDLTNDGVATLRAAFDFCEIDVADDMVVEIYNNHNFETMKEKRQSPEATIQTLEAHYRKGKTGTWRDDLSPLELLQFGNIASELMIDLSYVDSKKSLISNDVTTGTYATFFGIRMAEISWNLLKSVIKRR